ncbi:MAG: SH3 domain-containing protein, partial [Ruegeria sp.]
MKCAALALCLATSPVLAERMSFPPVDEAVNDPTLLAFRDSLLEQVAARDIDAVIAMACPDIYLSHGGNGGPEEFRANLTVDPETLPDEQRDQADKMRDAYWLALQDTLSQPGYFDDLGEFWMPHQWQITLPASLDPFQTYFVNGERVSLRQSPSRSAPITDFVSYEVVIITDYQQDNEYQSVVLTDGIRGYLHDDYLWSMVGYRAALVKSDKG